MQTERIENHRAQLTVEIEADQLETAKKQAARKISRSIRIKGFRKGKAPYRLVAQYVGEAAILEEAVETLGGELYKQALQESDITPYGPGAIEDFKPEPAPTFVFTVPLQPEVDLKDYTEIRLDFQTPEVSDEEVEQALKRLQMLEIEVLDDSVLVAEAGHRVRIDVDSEFVDGEEAEDADSDNDVDDADDSEESAESNEEDKPYIPRKGDAFIQEENAVYILDPNEDAFVDGFIDALIGAELGSDIIFELTIPDDESDVTIAGRRIEFKVVINQIESISVPELDDAFAETISKNRGDEIRDLDGLRELMREDLRQAAMDQAKHEYSDQVLEEMVEQAEIVYPEEMIEERIDEMVEEFSDNLKRQHLSLDDYLRFTNSSKEDMREQYRERAEESLRQTLVLREFAQVQNVEIDDEQIDLRLDLVAAGYGESPEIRKVFDTPEMRDNLRGDLFMSQVYARLCAIGQGEDPDAAAADLHAKLVADLETARLRSERVRTYLEAASDNEPDEPAVEQSQVTAVNSDVDEEDTPEDRQNDDNDQ